MVARGDRRGAADSDRHPDARIAGVLGHLDAGSLSLHRGIHTGHGRVRQLLRADRRDRAAEIRATVGAVARDHDVRQGRRGGRQLEVDRGAAAVRQRDLARLRREADALRAQRVVAGR